VDSPSALPTSQFRGGFHPSPPIREPNPSLNINVSTRNSYLWSISSGNFKRPLSLPGPQQGAELLKPTSGPTGSVFFSNRFCGILHSAVGLNMSFELPIPLPSFDIRFRCLHRSLSWRFCGFFFAFFTCLPRKSLKVLPCV